MAAVVVAVGLATGCGKVVGNDRGVVVLMVIVVVYEPA